MNGLMNDIFVDERRNNRPGDPDTVYRDMITLLNEQQHRWYDSAERWSQSPNSRNYWTSKKWQEFAVDFIKKAKDNRLILRALPPDWEDVLENAVNQTYKKKRAYNLRKYGPAYFEGRSKQTEQVVLQQSWEQMLKDFFNPFGFGNILLHGTVPNSPVVQQGFSEDVNPEEIDEDTVDLKGSGDIEIIIDGEAPIQDSVAVDVGVDTDLYNRLRLPDTTGNERFYDFITDTTKIDPQQRARLEFGLMRNGNDNPDRGTVVVVFRGSINADDFNTDRVFALRNLPSLTAKDLRSTPRYIRNRQFIVEQMNTYFNGRPTNGSNSYFDFYVTGHSLGGALSEVLSLDGLVHGGYSFSAPVDNPTHQATRGDRERGAPTYRSINKYDKVIGGFTDPTTGGDAIYDTVIEGTVYNTNKPVNEQMLGHELDWFKGQPTTTNFQIPPYKPGRLQRLMLGPVERINRTSQAVSTALPAMLKPLNPLPTISAAISPFNPFQPRRSPRLQSAAGRRYKKRKRGNGPPPAYPLALTLAKEAYSKSFDKPSIVKSSQHAILCPAPISNEEVQFYVCRWPRFNNDTERDTAIGNLVKILTREPLIEIEAYDKGAN
jgi:hypothetical protein